MARHWYEEQARRRGPRPPRVPAEASISGRQQLVALLELRAMDFDELREALRMSVRGLDEALGHVEKSLKHTGQELVVDPAVCSTCGFVFTGREQRHFHPPGRCPRCRGERIEAPRFSIRG